MTGKFTKEKIVVGVIGTVIVTSIVLFGLDVRHTHVNILIAYMAWLTQFANLLHVISIDKNYKITVPKGETRGEKIGWIIYLAFSILDLVIIAAFFFI